MTIGRWPSIDRRWAAKADRDWAAAPQQLVAAVDDAGRTVLVPDDRPRDTPRDEHEAPSLFNAPRTMRGQTSMEGIE